MTQFSDVLYVLVKILIYVFCDLAQNIWASLVGNTGVNTFLYGSYYTTPTIIHIIFSATLLTLFVMYAQLQMLSSIFTKINNIKNDLQQYQKRRKERYVKVSRALNFMTKKVVRIPLYIILFVVSYIILYKCLSDG